VEDESVIRPESEANRRRQAKTRSDRAAIDSPGGTWETNCTPSTMLSPWFEGEGRK